jgi:hypothetical protein
MKHSQITQEESYETQTNYSGQVLWNTARLLRKKVMKHRQITQEKSYETQTDYSGWDLGNIARIFSKGFETQLNYSE